MKVENKLPVANPIGINTHKKDPDSKSFLDTENLEGRSNRSDSKEATTIAPINSLVDNFASKKDVSPTTYNRFRTKNDSSKALDYVKTTILKPGTYNSIELKINYDGLSKADFRDVSVWKNTIGKTVYAINKTLEYVHDNSRTSFPSKIEFEENFTTTGFKDDNTFYNNLNTLAEKLAEGEIDLNAMKETVSSSLEKHY